MLPAQAQESPVNVLTFIGTYTNGKSKGIYSFMFDENNGKLKEIGTTGGIQNPSFLAIHPNGHFLYAASELDHNDGKPGGRICAFKIESGGKLTLINEQSAGGDGTCFVSLDKTGNCALVANYNDGSIASFEIAKDGSLSKAVSVIHHHGSSINPKRQSSQHAHSINVSPDNNFAFVADLGMDKIMSYKLEAHKAKLTPNQPPFCQSTAGAGPRHLAFSPDGKLAYVANELNSTVSVYSYKADGELKEIQEISTLPNAVADNTTAEIQVHPSGKFVYCSNRGLDSIAIFRVNSSTGKLSAAGQQATHGRIPRNFAICPNGHFLLSCNQDSDNVVVFKIDEENGSLSEVGEPATVPAPVCVKFLKTSGNK